MRDKQFAGIDKALKEDSLILSAFRSDQGVRVVRIEEPSEGREGDLKAYGEHPHFREALMLANADYLAEGRTSEPHYFTGSSEAEDGLDLWLLSWREMCSYANGENIILEALDGEKVMFSEEDPTFEGAYSKLGESIKHY